MTGFARGAGYLGRGLTFLRSRPRLLLLGMLPALLVVLALTALFVVVAFKVDDLVGWATPFADDWATALRRLVRILLAVAVLVGLYLLFAALFVGLTLTIGDPFYARIWRETEAMLDGSQAGLDVGAHRSEAIGRRCWVGRKFTSQWWGCCGCWASISSWWAARG